MKFTSPGRTLAALSLFFGVLLSDAPGALTTFYYDSFTRAGTLNGSTPTVSTNGNSWQQTYGDFNVGVDTYLTTGTAVSQGGSGAIDGSSYLPVNGTSGVMMDGTGDFVLSVVISQGGNTPMGIALNFTTYAGGSMFGTDGAEELLAGIVFNDAGNILAVYGGNIVSQAFLGIADGVPTLLTMSYSADLDQLSYSVNGGAAFFTQNSVTDSQINSLTFVSIDNSSFGNNTGSFDDFTLVVDVVPEPTAFALLGGLASAWLVRRRRFPAEYGGAVS